MNLNDTWFEGNHRMVKDIFSDLAERFPSGFRSEEAYKYLMKNHEERYFLYAYKIKHWLNKNFLKRISDNDKTGKCARYRYFVTIPEIDKHKKINFMNLMNTFITIETTKTLEGIIINNQQFIEKMSEIKKQDPVIYHQLGGSYLDKILVKSGIIQRE